MGDLGSLVCFRSNVARAVTANLSEPDPQPHANRVGRRPSRDLRALAQGVEVNAKEVPVMGSKSLLLRTLVAASSAETADFEVPSFVPNWRAAP